MRTDFNFDELKSNIEIATKKGFKENVQKYGSDICSFSLISDDGAMTVVPCTNTKRHLKKSSLKIQNIKNPTNLNLLNGLPQKEQILSLMKYAKHFIQRF